MEEKLLHTVIVKIAPLSIKVFISWSTSRNISMLLFLSKMFEKLMCARLDSYLKSNNILCTNPFGFRKNSKKSDAIIEFLDYVYSSLDEKQSTIAVYLDFSKALDTANHEISMSKLQHNGVRGVMLNWFNPAYLAIFMHAITSGRAKTPVQFKMNYLRHLP